MLLVNKIHPTFKYVVILKKSFLCPTVMVHSAHGSCIHMVPWGVPALFSKFLNIMTWKSASSMAFTITVWGAWEYDASWGLNRKGHLLRSGLLISESKDKHICKVECLSCSFWNGKSPARNRDLGKSFAKES